jgi:hypothetical protein
VHSCFWDFIDFTLFFQWTTCPTAWHPSSLLEKHRAYAIGRGASRPCPLLARGADSAFRSVTAAWADVAAFCAIRATIRVTILVVAGSLGGFKFTLP